MIAGTLPDVWFLYHKPKWRWLSRSLYTYSLNGIRSRTRLVSMCPSTLVGYSLSRKVDEDERQWITILIDIHSYQPTTDCYILVYHHYRLVSIVIDVPEHTQMSYLLTQCAPPMAQRETWTLIGGNFGFDTKTTNKIFFPECSHSLLHKYAHACTHFVCGYMGEGEGVVNVEFRV